MKADRVAIYCEILTFALERSIQQMCRGSYAWAADAMQTVHHLPGILSSSDLREERYFLGLEEWKPGAKDRWNGWMLSLSRDLMCEPIYALHVKPEEKKVGWCDWGQVRWRMEGATEGDVEYVGADRPKTAKETRNAIYSRELDLAVMFARNDLRGFTIGVTPAWDHDRLRKTLDRLQHVRKLPGIIVGNDLAAERAYLFEDCSRMKLLYPRWGEDMASGWDELKKSLDREAGERKNDENTRVGF